MKSTNTYKPFSGNTVSKSHTSAFSKLAGSNQKHESMKNMKLIEYQLKDMLKRNTEEKSNLILKNKSVHTN